VNIFASTSESLRPHPIKFQDFPGPKSFPGLCRSWKFYKKILNFAGVSRRRGNPAFGKTTHLYRATKGVDMY